MKLRQSITNCPPTSLDRRRPIKNTARGVLTRYNQDRANLFSVAGREHVEGLGDILLQEDAWVLDDLFDELKEQTARLKKVEKRLEEFAQSAPLREREARAVLDTMPGVGLVTIETILAELGDWTRFKNGAAVVSYAGLDPGVRDSDGRRKGLKITKAGSPLLRWVMIQLAHRMKRTSRWGRVFEQISRRAGKKKATVAMARRLLTVIFAMLRDGREYQMAADEGPLLAEKL
ncbi:MAG: transposase [Planctomycetota bacterium]|nr:transposase [Planctomycetota bacterium]